jgi:DNA-directed RNA polymerase specialized sigma24 family protein
MSYDEIARATGLTESAVKTQLHRARRMLAERLVAQNAGSSSSNAGTPAQSASQ